MNLHVSRMQEDPQKQELPSDGTEKLRTALETLRAGMAELRRLKEGLELHHRSLVARLWALRESEERHALAARAANDGLWDWDLKSDTVYFCARWKSMHGCEEAEIGNSPDEWFFRVHHEDIDRVKAEIDACLKGPSPRYQSEHRMFHKDGTYRWMLVRGLVLREGKENPYRMIGTLSDITDRKLTEEQIMHDAFHDALTGLPNRTLFMDRLRVSMNQARRRKGYSFAVLFLDLDHFKIVNDTQGHRIGDQLLAAVAGRIRTCQRPGDTVARLGGDEFAILLHDVEGGALAIRVAERIQEELKLPFNLQTADIVTTASIGIALSASGYDEPEDVLHDADSAMYLAKTNGRSRHEFFDRGLRVPARALVRAEADLRQAVERQEFLIHYQPIVSLASGRITGTEALLRWQHPCRGLVPPKEFLPLAVRTGLIAPIEEWVLRTACAQNKAWQEAVSPSLHVGVNLSASHLKDKRLPGLVERVLLETGMAAATLGLEIPEFVARKNLDLAVRTLNELSALGTQILLDDFGAADSSLASLKRFPVKTLKLDRSLVAGIATDSADAAITAAIIAMAHTLNMRVIAEGMETQDQLAFLRSRQCDAIQGNMFSQPLPAEGMTKLLQKAHLSGASASSMNE